MKKIITLFVAFLALVNVVSAKESITTYKHAPAECVEAVEAEFPYIIKAAESMGIVTIETSQIKDDLSNMELSGGYQKFYFDAEYLLDDNSGFNFYEAIDRTINERRLFILYVNEKPAMQITAVKTDNGEWSVEKFGEDATEMAKALTTILRKDSELYINGTIIFDRSGGTQRVVLAQEGKSDTVYKAADYMKYVKDSASYHTEKVKERNEAFEGEDYEYLVGQFGGHGGQDAPKFTAMPFVEEENSLDAWHIAIVILPFFGISFFVISKKRKISK